MLQSAKTVATENGRYGYVFDQNTQTESYDFIPGSGYTVTVCNKLLPSQIVQIETANRPASFTFVRDNLARLALHKHTRSGETTAQAFFADVASDIAGFGELTVVEACARLRRADSPFYPTSAEIIKMCEKVKAEIDALVAVPVSAKDIESQQKPRSIRLDFKMTPKEKWDDQHWDEYVSDASAMLQLATENPKIFSVDSWKEQMAIRQAERATAVTRQ